MTRSWSSSGTARATPSRRCGNRCRSRRNSRSRRWKTCAHRHIVTYHSRCASASLHCLRLPPTSPSTLRAPSCRRARGHGAAGALLFPSVSLFCVVALCAYCVFCVACFRLSMSGSCLSLRVSCLVYVHVLRLSRRTMRLTFLIPPSACLCSPRTTHRIIVIYIHTVLQLRVSSYSTVFRLSTFTHGVMRGAITLSADIVGICIIFMLYNLGTLLVVHLTSSRRWVRVIIGSEGQGSHLDASVSGVVLGLSSRRFLVRAASSRLPPPEDLRRRDQDAR